MVEERNPHKEPSRRSLAREERRERAAKRQSRRRLFLGSIAGSVGLLVIAGLFVPQLGHLGGPSSSQPEVDRTAGTQVPIQPGGIIEVGAAHPAYATSPPTSGPRYDEAAAWGVHAEPQPDEQVVRNLEVGGIAVNYNAADASLAAQLATFIQTQPGAPGCFIVQPHEAVSAGNIVLTAWGWREEVNGVNTHRMQAFIDAHKNQGQLFLGEDCGFAEATQATSNSNATPSPDATPETAGGS